MKNDKIRDVLLESLMINKDEHIAFYTDDKDINKCLVNMYFYMLSNGMDEKIHYKYWKKFQHCFCKLNKVQQEIIKNEYNEIINTLIKYKKEKVKKKGMINYE